MCLSMCEGSVGLMALGQPGVICWRGVLLLHALLQVRSLAANFRVPDARSLPPPSSPSLSLTGFRE